MLRHKDSYICMGIARASFHPRTPILVVAPLRHAHAIIRSSSVEPHQADKPRQRRQTNDTETVMRSNTRRQIRMKSRQHTPKQPKQPTIASCHP